MFVFDNRILENDSLMEIKSELDDEQWDELVHNTAEFYMQLNAARKASMLDKPDLRICRSLKRTLKMVEKLDPVTYGRHVNDEKQDEYDNVVSGEISSMSSMVKIGYGNKPDGVSDIMVSKL